MVPLMISLASVVGGVVCSPPKFPLSEKTWDVFAADVPQVKLTWQRHAVRILNVTSLGYRYVFVEHSIHGNVPRARLVDQALYRDQIEISLHTVGIKGRR